MTFRPTTIERAYQRAEGGTCRTPGAVKEALKQEGFSAIQDQLYGASITRALKQRCDANYVAPEAEAAATGVVEADDDDSDRDEAGDAGACPDETGRDASDTATA